VKLADHLTDARNALEEQLKALQEQQRRVERALSELGGEVRRGPGRPRGSRSSGGAKRRGAAKPRRRRRGGTRREQTLELVKQNPGLGVSELAGKLKIKPNYPYRVLGELSAEGLVKKRGKGFVAS